LPLQLLRTRALACEGIHPELVQRIWLLACRLLACWLLLLLPGRLLRPRLRLLGRLLLRLLGL